METKINSRRIKLETSRMPCWRSVSVKWSFNSLSLNRESNTVLSKTGGLGDLGLTVTDLALAAKSEIDKIREQSLNLE